MDVGIFFFHNVADSCEFRSSTFTTVFFFQNKHRFFCHCRAVFPDFIDQIHIVFDSYIFGSQCFFPVISLSCGDDLSIKCQFSILRKIVHKIFLDRRHIRLSHAVKVDSASLQLFFGLDKISSVCPKPCFVFGNDGSSGRTCEAGNEFSCHEILADIFALVIV